MEAGPATRAAISSILSASMTITLKAVLTVPSGATWHQDVQPRPIVPQPFQATSSACSLTSGGPSTPSTSGLPEAKWGSYLLPKVSWWTISVSGLRGMPRPRKPSER